MSDSHARVVVGVDGHRHSDVAVDWAIEAALRQQRGLRLVHARAVPMSEVGQLAAVETSEDDARTVLAAARERVRAIAPRMEVTTSMPIGRAATILVEESSSAGLVVVGARGRRAVTSALLGSTSLDVAAHARCPVVVVRELPTSEERRAGVVVGVDGSPTDEVAVGEAFREADARGLPVTVVHTWVFELADTGLSVLDSADARRQIAEEQQALARRSLVGWTEKYPDVPVRLHVLSSHPVASIVEHSRDAELVVVGSRGRGGFAGLLLGSVSQGVLHYAHCPVMVVRSDRAR